VKSPVSRAPSAAPKSPASSVGTKRKERDYDEGEATNIHVVVRCRGRNDREVRENSGVVVSTSGVKGTTVELSMGPNAISNKTYHFDKVFSAAADQVAIYEDVVSPFLNEMLNGFNCTIFAYGQTGTGKTYTMSGDMTDTMGLLSDAAGIIPRVLYTLFQKLESEEMECAVKCSFIELYNEELRDLLSADDSVKLKIYDDANKKSHTATLVQGMEESHIKDAAAGIKLLQKGSYRRQVAATKCNDLSSRSHTVFTITTYAKKPGNTGDEYICAGKLNLVDLAGSENIQRSGAENKRAAEAGLINKSLLTLGRVINALVDKSSHIPYRESKLTRLLQDSLGGRTKTCIIATVSPAKSNLEETISTLDYAFRAKNIRNKPQVNSVISKKTLLKEFTAEIEKLKSELIATRQRNGVYLTNEQFEEITVESESRRILSEEQKARIETMEVNLRNKVQELYSLTISFTTLKRDTEATRSVLESTKDVLLQTEFVLQETRQTLQEETALKEAHAVTETKLYSIGKSLLTTLDESVGHSGSLHEKIDRQSALISRNQNGFQGLLELSNSCAQEVSLRLEETKQAHEEQLGRSASRVHTFVTDEISKIAQSRSFLESRKEDLRTKAETIEQQSSDAKDGMNTVLEEIKVLREEVKERVGEGLQGLSEAAAKISGEVISELDQFHNQLFSSYSSLGRDFKAMFEDMTKQLAAQREEANRLRTALQDANRKYIEASLTASSKLEACLEEEREASRQERDQLMQQVSALISNSFTKQENRFATRIHDIQAHIVDSTEVFEAANDTYQQGMDKWTVQDSTLMGMVSKSRDETKNKLKNDWQAVNTRNTAIQTSTKAVHEQTVEIVDAQLKEMATQMEALDEFVTRARSQNDSNHREHVSSLQSMTHVVQESFRGVEADLAQRSANVGALESDYNSRVGEATVTFAHHTTSMREPLERLRNDLAKRPWEVYAPTGATPVKKDWIYTTNLPRTNPPTVMNPPPMGRTPSRLASPQKVSPSKLPVYTDQPPPAAITLAEIKGGLKEVDVNVGSVSAFAGRPPLKKQATGKKVGGRENGHASDRRLRSSSD